MTVQEVRTWSHNFGSLDNYLEKLMKKKYSIIQIIPTDYNKSILDNFELTGAIVIVSKETPL